MDNKINKELRQAAYIAAGKELPVIEKELWKLITNNTEELIEHGLLSASDSRRLKELRAIEAMIYNKVQKAGEVIPHPDYDYNPAYPKEYIKAKKRLAELQAPLDQVEEINKAVYHAGSRAYSWLIYGDRKIAALADSIREQAYKIRQPLNIELDNLTGFVERRTRVGSIVWTIRHRLFEEYEAKVKEAKAARRLELETQYACQLSEIIEIEERIEAAREVKIRTLAIRVEAILEVLKETLAEPVTAGAAPDPDERVR